MKKTTDSLKDEYKDQCYYKAWYVYWKLEEGWKLNNKQLEFARDYLLKNAKDESNKK